MTVTHALLDPLLSGASGKPLITYYDDATGARIELSRATAANWAAKTANWLVDEHDVQPGTRVSVALPPHWQTVGVLLGSWWCGAHVVEDPKGAEVAFVPADHPTAAGAFITAVVGLDALGAPVRDLPGGAVDYVSDIRVHGDEFSPPTPVPGTAPALLDSSIDEVVQRARTRAQQQEITAEDRVMSTWDWDLPGGVVDGLLAPLAAGAHLVQCANADPANLPRRREAEKVTRDLGES